MRAFAFAAVVVAAAGCGSHGQQWPDCLRILGTTHVQVANAAQLAETPRVFAIERAAAIGFGDGDEATVVVAGTVEAARKTAVALTSVPSVITLPLPATLPQPTAVLRRGTVVMQWFGLRNPRRQQALLDCATT